MKIQRISSVQETLAKLIFLVLPTVAIGYFILFNANSYFSILQNQALLQSIYFGAGMFGACIFYAFRFRFSSTFILLALVFYSIYKGLDSTAIGEFDTFFITVRFIVFSTLFIIGWLLGAAFSRARYTHYFIASAFLLSCILIIAKQRIDTAWHIFYAFLPAVLYSFYVVFAAEQIYNYKDKNAKFWWFMSRRIFFFVLLTASLSLLVAKSMEDEIKAAIAESRAKDGKDGESGMLKKNKDGDFDLNDYAQLRSNQGRSNELLFAAHIDSYLPGTDIPNPLYLTAFYYTKFDTSTETFERDKTIPKDDLFQPDVSKIPLYSTRTDSSVINNGMGDLLRRTVEMEVYNKQLSPKTFLAPNIGFFVQPIAIEKDYRKEFKSAFRAKGYVSDLNSAYFIYNAKDPQLRKFQEQRFEVLRNVSSYEKVDKKFMAYYTQMPSDEKFQRITALAQRVTAKAKTPVDKVLALRDYFLSKDDEGKALFSYTDNPGVPDIPSASKLMYFLFDNHKGYCAYYAGATLFMLRSLGIPSRITVGFMTIDRSDKNKGWYWYYADQAHAWVQVYFPGYGWLDFDTTVGNDDAQESPKPDGTPPMQPPHAWFASEGQIVAVDSVQKTVKLKFGQFLFHDKEFKLDPSGTEMLLDVSLAAIQRDSVNVNLNQIRIGDSATVVSYAELFKKMPEAGADESALDVLKRISLPAPIDDVYLKKTPQQIKEELLQKEKPLKAFSLKQFLLYSCIIIVGLILLFLSIPFLIFNYFKIRAIRSKTVDNKAYWQYRAFSFYLHQLGFFRGNNTPMYYAQNIIDRQLSTSFASFMNIYLKMKYTGQKIQATEAPLIHHFLEKNIRIVQGQCKATMRFISFLRPLRAINFFNNKHTLS